MPLALHLSIHFIVAVLTGYFSGRYFKRPVLGVIAGISGGFLIDLDHVLEYFLVFGLKFNLEKFFDGWEFLASGQIRLWFHAWELVPVLLLVAYLFRKKKVFSIFILILTTAGFVHLISDCFINNYPLRNYSLIYRASRGFSAERLLSPAQYAEYLKSREWVGF